MGHRRTTVIALVGLLLGARMAAAQIPLREVIPTMLGPGMSIAPGAGGTHANDFARAFGEPDFVFSGGKLQSINGPQATITTDVRGRAFNAAIVEQLTTFPIGSSSGGFLYGFDPAIGTFTRSSRSFGTSYGERSLTSGRGTFSVGFAVQNVEFTGFDETSLDSGQIQFVYAHRDLVAGAPLTPERSDVMEATLRLNILSRSSMTMFTYGVTDRLDIGATIPMNQTTLAVQVDKRILRLGTSDPAIHSFDGLGSIEQTSTGGGTVSGLGDVRVVAKYNFLRRGNTAVAVQQDVRLPTGDDRNLLGTGTLVSRTLGILSTGNRTIALNTSFGATFATKNLEAQQFVGTPSDEMNVSLGFDSAVVPRATISADMVFRRRLDHTIKMSPEPRVVEFRPSANAPLQSRTLNEFQPTELEKEVLTTVIVGTKVNPWRNLLLVGNVLLGVPQFGLTYKSALSLGVEYTF